jgi:hypothetical protein
VTITLAVRDQQVKIRPARDRYVATRMSSSMRCAIALGVLAAIAAISDESFASTAT